MLETFNLTAFGAFHTAIALVAVVAGIVAIARFGEIGTGTRAGLVFVVFTALACITGLFIFRHGGFGPPHALALLTLLVLAICYALEKYASPAGFARYVVVLGYSLTLFFHLIPGLTETGTRLPLGAPAFSGPEDTTLTGLVGVGFAVYLAGAALQVLRIRKTRRPVQAVLGA
jgi:uncharacterized membrane protein